MSCHESSANLSHDRVLGVAVDQLALSPTDGLLNFCLAKLTLKQRRETFL